MATIYKPTYTTTDKQCRKVTKRARHWYVRYKDGNGKTCQVKGYTDKGMTQQLAANLQARAQRQQVGLADPHEQHRRRPIAEHLSDFERHLNDKDNTPKYIDLTIQRCRDLFDGINAKTISDIDGGRVASYLKDRRDICLSIESSNHYFRAMRNFCRWLVRDRRLPENPVQHLSTLKADKDRRHLRRILPVDEFSQLITATHKAPTMRGLTGHDRAMLYITAAYTGLRASELASLTWAAFDFESNPPVLTLGAHASKYDEEDVVPLRADVTSMLRDWLSGQPSDALLWPGKWAEHGAAGKMLKADLKRAGVAYQDASGRFADFHALRHTFISALARTGAHPKVAQTLARHKTLDMTLSRYTHVLGGDLVTALANLPAPPSPNAQTTTAALAATGTDGDPKIACTLFAPDGVFDCHSVALNGATDQGADTSETDHKSLETASLDNECHDMSSIRPGGLEPPTCGSMIRRVSGCSSSRTFGR